MATTITIPRPRRAFPRRVEPTNDHQVQRPPQLPGSPGGSFERIDWTGGSCGGSDNANRPFWEVDIINRQLLGPQQLPGASDWSLDDSASARELRELDDILSRELRETDDDDIEGRIPKVSTIPRVVIIQQPVGMPGATLSVGTKPFGAPNDSQTPPIRPTAVEERRRATIRASSRSDRHHFDLDSRRRRTLLHKDSDVSEPEPEEDSSELSTGAVVDEAEQQVIADDDDDDDDDDGAPTRWEPKNNMMLGCKEGDELWCFKYGVMAFAMKGDYHAALALRDHFRRLFVRPLGGSVSLQCASCNRVLRYRPELIWHYQLGNCAETGDIPLGQCLGYGVSLVHFVQPFAIDIIQRTTFENNQRLDLLDPNLPTICNQFHPCQWTAHQEKKRENQYRSWKKANKTLGKIIKKKNDWYQQQVRYGSVPIGHMRMLRSDSYHFPFVKRFEDWTEAEKVAAGSQSP